MFNQIDFKTAVNIMKKALSEDEELYFAYKSNIAMAFYDTITNAGYTFPDLLKLSNDAADNFLTLFIKY